MQDACRHHNPIDPAPSARTVRRRRESRPRSDLSARDLRIDVGINRIDLPGLQALMRHAAAAGLAPVIVNEPDFHQLLRHTVRIGRVRIGDVSGEVEVE